MEESAVAVEMFDEIDSTSRSARRLIERGEAGDRARLIVAATQTGGVGRLGRAWASPRGGLWCTLLWPVRGDARLVLDGLGVRIGAACVRVIDGCMPADRSSRVAVELKWPNDVLLNGKKVLGVLTESVPAGGITWILVGVGVNANFAASQLPLRLRREPTTLQEALGGPVELAALRESVVRYVVAACGRCHVAEDLALVRSRLYGLGSDVTFKGGSGTLVGLGDDGCPLIKLADGRIVSGDTTDST